MKRMLLPGVLHIIACLLVFLLLLPSQAYAATVSVSGVVSSINKDDEFSVSVTVSGAAANTTNYLRAAFYSDNSPTSYFGYTYNHSGSWYNGTPSPIDPHQFLQISIGPDGAWTDSVRIKPDSASSYFNGVGQYYLKIGRYTANGTSVTDWSSANSIAINDPTPPTPTSTPTPDPTSTPTTVPTPTKTPTPVPSITPTKTPTPVPTVTKTPTPSPTVKITASPTKKIDLETIQKAEAAEKDRLPTSVLGESTKETEGPSPTPLPETKDNKNYVPFILVGLGIVFIAGFGILSYPNLQFWRKDNNAEI